MVSSRLTETDRARHQQIEGAHNLRHLGHYEVEGGARTRPGALYRAADVHALPPASQQRLVDLGIRTVVDLRGSRELSEARSVFADHPTIRYYPRNMTGDDLIARWGALPVPADSSDRLSRMYSAVLDERGAAIREILETLAEPEALPALFHCTAGKDRTGVLAALLLGLAGVVRSDIESDYAKSALFLYGTPVLPRDVPQLPLDAYQRRWSPQGAMARTLDHLDAQYGGIVGYASAIGVQDASAARLRGALGSAAL